MNIKVGKYYLDDEQSAIVYDNTKHLLVIAGAGSGKTLTILGKISYLVNNLKIDPNDIISISFTKASADSLKNKIKTELNLTSNVYTFHKLSLEILKYDKKYDIADPETLDHIINNFFTTDILLYPKILKQALYYFNLKTKKQYINYSTSCNPILENTKKLLATFLHLFKTNNHQTHEFSLFIRKARRTLNYKKYKKEKIFLIFALNILLKYQHYLEENNEIDFDDMLIKASQYVDKHGYNKSVKYIIIDEYQDTSLIRLNLIKSILNKTGASLMVVGDDFQSIYRFTGCDLALFLNFRSYFNDSKNMKIQNTYRNSQELITIAGNFVMKNKQQITKNLRSSKSIQFPIQVVYYSNPKDAFLHLLLKVHSETHKKVLVLSRNNNDIYKFINKDDFSINQDFLTLKNNPEITFQFLTVHRSKGLECDNVIVLNMSDDILGFPSQLKNEDILRFVSQTKKDYPYSEERRLFYVALTRTKNIVYLLTPNKNQSVFIKELLTDYKNQILIIKDLEVQN